MNGAGPIGKHKKAVGSLPPAFLLVTPLMKSLD